MQHEEARAEGRQEKQQPVEQYGAGFHHREPSDTPDPRIAGILGKLARPMANGAPQHQRGYRDSAGDHQRDEPAWTEELEGEIDPDERRERKTCGHANRKPFERARRAGLYLGGGRRGVHMGIRPRVQRFAHRLRFPVLQHPVPAEHLPGAGCREVQQGWREEAAEQQMGAT